MTVTNIFMLQILNSIKCGCFCSGFIDPRSIMKGLSAEMLQILDVMRQIHEGEDSNWLHKTIHRLSHL